jgi:hypothetical protein
VRRPPVPAFIAELFADPTARNCLLAGSAALFAAALDPKVWGPALPNVQAAIRERPELEAIGAFQDVLAAVGTPSFSQVSSAVDPAEVAPYVDAYASGVRAALAMGGLTAVIGGLIAWVALGRRDPLATVWELRDERAAVAD